VKTELLLAASPRSGLEVTDEDIEAEHQRIAERYKLELDKSNPIVSDGEHETGIVRNKAMEIVTSSYPGAAARGQRRGRRTGAGGKAE
jgi:hypothetical protein